MTSFLEEPHLLRVAHTISDFQQQQLTPVVVEQLNLLVADTLELLLQTTRLILQRRLAVLYKTIHSLSSPKAQPLGAQLHMCSLRILAQEAAEIFCIMML
nr:MAG TPA: hypothetical protein [Caudoviricetes sp.]